MRRAARSRTEKAAEESMPDIAAWLLAAALAVLALAPATAGAADVLGRLFFSPEQRQDLDRRRQANMQETVVAPPPTITESLVTINVGSSRVDLQACKLEYSIVSPK